MDLLSMFTADAAARHGHEFSRATTSPPALAGNGLAPQNPPMRLPRSPLTFVPRARLPTNSMSRSRPRPQSMKITMAELTEDPEGEQADEEEELRKIEAKIRSFTIPGAFEDTPPESVRSSVEGLSAPMRMERARSTSPSLEVAREDAKLVMDVSESASTTTEVTVETNQSKRNLNRPKVFYRLGRPVHAERKHFVRPKCLLQVQQTGGKFHRPMFDVVPGSRFAPRTKIGQKLRRLKRNKDGTGADDLVVVKSEHRHDGKEDTSEEEHEKDHDHEDETLNGREVLGTIQPAEDGPSAYISLGDTVWKATLDGTGYSYTLENASDATDRVRWFVPKTKRAAASSGAAREFSFAPLQLGSKRHPVVANLSEGHLEYFEEYMLPSEPSRALHTDEAMRRLIIVSGLWVYFCEGWSKHYDFHSAVAKSARPTPGRSRSTRSARGLGQILRSPSGSPAPSIRCTASTSSDTRSREGSHDSAITSTNTISPSGTMIRRSTTTSSGHRLTPTGSRAPSPDPHTRGRRRWSASFTTHLRRLSYSVKHQKEHQPKVCDETGITADVLRVEDPPTPIEIDTHPLQRAFMKPTASPTKVLVPDIRPVASNDSDYSTPTTLTCVDTDTKASVAKPTEMQEHSTIKIATTAPLPSRTLGSAGFAVLAATPPPSTPSQLDGPGDGAPLVRPSSPPRPHRFGLGDLARPKTVFTPRHQRSESSSSGSDGEAGGAGWWSQYDRMVLKRTSLVVPTS